MSKIAQTYIHYCTSVLVPKPTKFLVLIGTFFYRAKKTNAEKVIFTGTDPKRPWRTNSNKEKLLRVDSELKRHQEKSSQMIVPLAEQEMQDLVRECKDEGRVAPAVGANRLRDTVDAAKKNLPHFQYKQIYNTTATAILPQAHAFSAKSAQPKESSTIIE